MLKKQFDAIVVGAGIVGSCTAFHLQKAGRKTLLIEQFSLGHLNGSSHGKSRITRYAHAEPEYVQLVSDSYAEIEKLEKKRGEQLIIKTGGVMLGSTKYTGTMAKTLSDFSLPHEQLTAQEVHNRYPHLCYGDDYTALFDPQAGCILADKWMNAFQDEFRKAGGEVCDNTTVNSFNESETYGVTINTSAGDFTAPKVVLCLGTWINKLLPNLPVKGRPDLLSVCYWAPKNPSDLAMITPDKYPIHIARDPEGRSFFSMPSIDYEGTVKFIYNAGQVLEDTDKPVLKLDEKFVELARAHIEKHVPFLDTVNGPVRVDYCKYTMAPDHHYVVDFLPGSSKIVVAGCMSGSGFKNAPGLGRAISQLVRGEKPFVDLSFFSLKRFDN